VGASNDPTLNSALAVALKQARKFDVPSATIQRALNKASRRRIVYQFVLSTLDCAGLWPKLAACNVRGPGRRESGSTNVGVR
jgi:hypothetical protein